MKLASFHADGRDRIGVQLSPETLADVADLLKQPPEDMHALILMGDVVLDELRVALKEKSAGLRAFSVDSVSWQPPVRTPSKVVCLALNNRALDAIKIRAPTDHPAFFLKPFTALTGHRTAIRLRSSYGLTHPEPELAVVIGRTLSSATADETMDAVYGYTICNDITSVGMREQDSFSVRYFKPGPKPRETTPAEGHTSYPGRYKASDTFAPMGPWLVTKDEIPDPRRTQDSVPSGRSPRRLRSHKELCVGCRASALAHLPDHDAAPRRHRLDGHGGGRR